MQTEKYCYCIHTPLKVVYSYTPVRLFNMYSYTQIGQVKENYVILNKVILFCGSLGSTCQLLGALAALKLTVSRPDHVIMT